MPTLKQITCSVEIGDGHKLTEYGARYSDGVVETFIPVPDVPDLPFSIRLKSEGYIAPGLAMYVFIDGEYQCNRNRQGLKLPDEGVKPSQYEVGFRVRQKEEKMPDGRFIGRDWTFTELNVAKANDTANLNNYVQRNFGTIEVLVLRCGREGEVVPTPHTSFTMEYPPVKPTKGPAVSVKAPSTVAAPSLRAASGSGDMMGGMFGLFDGACDIGLDGAGDVMDKPLYHKPAALDVGRSAGRSHAIQTCDFGLDGTGDFMDRPPSRPRVNILEAAGIRAPNVPPLPYAKSHVSSADMTWDPIFGAMRERSDAGWARDDRSAAHNLRGGLPVVQTVIDSTPDKPGGDVGRAQLDGHGDARPGVAQHYWGERGQNDGHGPPYYGLQGDERRQEKYRQREQGHVVSESGVAMNPWEKEQYAQRHNNSAFLQYQQQQQQAQQQAPQAHQVHQAQVQPGDAQLFAQQAQYIQQLDERMHQLQAYQQGRGQQQPFGQQYQQAHGQRQHQEHQGYAAYQPHLSGLEPDQIHDQQRQRVKVLKKAKGDENLLQKQQGEAAKDYLGLEFEEWATLVGMNRDIMYWDYRNLEKWQRDNVRENIRTEPREVLKYYTQFQGDRMPSRAQTQHGSLNQEWRMPQAGQPQQQHQPDASRAGHKQHANQGAQPANQSWGNGVDQWNQPNAQNNDAGDQWNDKAQGQAQGWAAEAQQKASSQSGGWGQKDQHKPPTNAGTRNEGSQHKPPSNEPTRSSQKHSRGNSKVDGSSWSNNKSQQQTINNDGAKDGGGGDGWAADTGGAKQSSSTGNAWDNNKRSKKSSSARPPSAGGDQAFPEVDLKAHIQPYWANWRQTSLDRESSDPNTKKKRDQARDACLYPAKPAPTIPSGTKTDASHGVQAGRGANYAHRCLRPLYLDEMDAPYAVFSFKYRSKEKLEKILGKKIDADITPVVQQAEKDKLMSLPKDELVKVLMEMKTPPPKAAKQASSAPAKAASVKNDWTAKSERSSQHEHFSKKSIAGSGWVADNGQDQWASNGGKSKTPSTQGGKSRGASSANKADNNAAPGWKNSNGSNGGDGWKPDGGGAAAVTSWDKKSNSNGGAGNSGNDNFGAWKTANDANANADVWQQQRAGKVQMGHPGSNAHTPAKSAKSERSSQHDHFKIAYNKMGSRTREMFAADNPGMKVDAEWKMPDWAEPPKDPRFEF